MRKLLALFAACSVVLACDTRQTSLITAPLSAELGTYTLQSVSGRPLPVQLASLAPNTVRMLTADSIRLTSGGNVKEVFYTSTTTTGSSNPPVVGSFSFSGHYTITRDSVGMPSDFPYKFGRYSNGTLTLTDASGFVWLFTRPGAT